MPGPIVGCSKLTHLAPTSSTVDIRVSVKGGGHTSQVYAIRQAIAKALVAYYAKYYDAASALELRQLFVAYDRTLLIADPRRMEPKKYVSSFCCFIRRIREKPSFFSSVTFMLILPEYIRSFTGSVVRVPVLAARSLTVRRLSSWLGVFRVCGRGGSLHIYIWARGNSSVWACNPRLLPCIDDVLSSAIGNGIAPSACGSFGGSAQPHHPLRCRTACTLLIMSHSPPPKFHAMHSD